MLKKNNISRAQISIFLALIIALVISGFLNPLFQQNRKDNWDDIVESKISIIEQKATKEIDSAIKYVINFSLEIKRNLSSNYLKVDSNKTDLFSYVADEKFKHLSIQIFSEDSIITAWNNYSFKKDTITKLTDYELGEAFFNTHDLITYITIIDTIDYKSGYELIVGMPIEKSYSLANEYYKSNNLTKRLSQKYGTPFSFEFNPGAKFTLDGREYSFEILNNFSNKIGVVTFQKPALSKELNQLDDLFSSIQAIIIIIIFVLIGYSLLKNISRIRISTLKSLILSIYFIVLRILLLYFNIPNKFITGAIAKNEYFSSEFGYGIVSSPLDLFITLLFFSVICFIIFRAATKFSRLTRSLSTAKYFLITSSALVLFLLLLRGFNASIRSFIFDSTLRYFSDVSIKPANSILLMEINLILLAVCSLIISISLIIALMSLRNKLGRKKIISQLIVLLIVFQLTGTLYDIIQPHPQGTPILRILYITLSFLLAYFLYFHRSFSLNYIFIAFSASIISISLLNFYNSELEKKLLKDTALKLIRPDERFIKDVIEETFNSSIENKMALKAFDSWDSSFDASSFILWSGSTLYDEGLSCEINFLDLNKNYLGGYSANFSNYYRTNWESDTLKKRIQFKTENLIFSDSKIINGIVPIYKDQEILGFLSISVLYDVDSFEFGDIPDFLKSRKGQIDPAVDFAKINFFDFHDKILVNELSDFSLSKDEMETITTVVFSESNEVWLSIPLKNEMYRVYVYKHIQSGFERILAVAMREKEVTLNLYEFFKIFFIHSLLILTLIILYIIWGLTKERKLRFTFQTRLFSAFLIISIIPLIFLAGYFRILTEDKNSSAILYKLGKRAFSVESYINDYLSNSSLNLTTILEKANRDLGINFTIYKNEKLYYSSQVIYYDIGLLPSLLNPVAYSQLVLSEAREFVLDEKIENYAISSFYYRGNIGQDEYIFKVDDVFNPIQLPMSDVEINIFLFGSYSIAVILITILSTILANQIASPIKKLTGATRSVAGGDLNIKLINRNRGEIGELVNGFNLMVKELRKSQAELAELERETAWKEMAKQVAHEIKNPLTPMKLSVQQLAAAYKDKSHKFESIFEKVTSTLIGQIETLKNIATEFSNFGRMPKINVVNINLKEVLQYAVNLFTDEDVRIEIKSSKNELKILADEDQMRRTFINLIRNSIQAKAHKIIFTIEETNSNCYLRIMDNGEGIPLELISKIFDRNFTTKSGGMGIGLNLAKKYIENINGSIKIENSSKEGTTILITFPVTEING